MRGSRIALAAAVIAVAMTSGCSSDDTDQGRPTRVTCFDGGKIIVDDFVDETSVHGADPRGAYMTFTSSTQKGTINVIGTCVSRPAMKPAGWKPIFPG